MARPQKLPDAGVLHQLRTVGTDSRPGKWTYDQIAAEYGTTRQGVHAALKKSHLVTPANRYTTEIPWKVAESDNHHFIVEMLRMAARIRRGEDLPAYRIRWVEKWVRDMAEVDAVVDYKRGAYEDPQGPAGNGWMQGWGYVARRPQDGWLIREPEAAVQSISRLMAESNS